MRTSTNCPASGDMKQLCQVRLTIARIFQSRFTFSRSTFVVLMTQLAIPPGRSICCRERVTLDKTAPLKLVPQIVLVVGVTFISAAVDRAKRTRQTANSAARVRPWRIHRRRSKSAARFQFR